jgi:dinuclear metal center YbgI/SA1388 family protein
MTWIYPPRADAKHARYDAPPMTTVSDILTALDRAVPDAASSSWDPSGLQVGDPAAEVSGVGVCHEVTEEVVAAAESERPDLLVTYHPLLFQPTNRLVAGSNPAGRALRLARAGITLAVVHTSFDAAPGGTADALAAGLGLADVRPFGPAGPAASVKVVTFVPADAVETVTLAMSAVGAGRIGNYSGCSFRISGTGAFDAGEGSAPTAGGRGENRVEEVRVEMLAPVGAVGEVTAALVTAHPYEEPAYDVYETVSNGRFIGRIGSFEGAMADLVATVTTVLGSEGLRVSAVAEQIGTVAVLPGSGSSFTGAARAAGADVLVTGDVDHHRVIEANDRGLSIIDPGHGPTERPGMAALVNAVRSAAGSTPVLDLTGYDPTPWR